MARHTHRLVRAMGVCGVWIRYILLSVRCVSAWAGGEGGGEVSEVSLSYSLNRGNNQRSRSSPQKPGLPFPRHTIQAQGHTRAPHLRGRAHGLLGHLTLVHVAGRLIEVRVGGEGGHHAEHAAGVELCSRGDGGEAAGRPDTARLERRVCSLAARLATAALPCPPPVCVNLSRLEPPSPPSGTRMFMLFCSSVPIISAAPLAICLTGRIMRAACGNGGPRRRTSWVHAGRPRMMR